MSSIPICRERVTNVGLRQDSAVCLFGNQTKLFLSRFLGSRVAVGDEIAFPVATGNGRGTEILITNNAASGPNHCLYRVPIGYVSQPKQDKRNQHFVSAKVNRGGLGIGM
jgi:ribosomal protein L27